MFHKHVCSYDICPFQIRMGRSIPFKPKMLLKEKLKASEEVSKYVHVPSSQKLPEPAFSAGTRTTSEFGNNSIDKDFLIL